MKSYRVSRKKNNIPLGLSMMEQPETSCSRTIKNLLTNVMIGKLVQQTLRNSCGGGLLAGSHHVAGVLLESPSLMDHTV